MTARRDWLRPPSVETLFVLAFALLGLRLGLRSIGDNSTFVHLRTGIDIVSGKGIPRTDPYSFTAAGHTWVVQSWLVAATYGLLHKAGGYEAVVVFHGVVYALLGALLAHLARTGSAVRTCAAAAAVIGIGVATWSPRPLAVGLVAFALTVLVVERRASAWWLVPIGWVWVNSHGSFVLGGVWLVLTIVGGQRDRARTYLPWWTAGVAAGAINPLGPRLLTFPLTLVEKSSNFARVVEWRAPTFRGPFGLVTLVSLVAVVVILARGRQRLGWDDVLPAAAFLGLALASQRNLGPAAVVLAPVLGRAWASADSTTEPQQPPMTHLAAAAFIGLAGVIFVAGALTAHEPLDLDGYPVRAVAHLGPNARRIASTDIGGCYLVLRRGRGAGVFVDDRFDMYPRHVVDDYLALYDGKPASTAILDRYDVDAVVWPTDAPLTSILLQDEAAWRRTYRDSDWSVFERQ